MCTLNKKSLNQPGDVLHSPCPTFAPMIEENHRKLTPTKNMAPKKLQERRTEFIERNQYQDKSLLNGDPPWVIKNSCTRWVPGSDVTIERFSPQTMHFFESGRLTILTNQQLSFAAWSSLPGTHAGISDNPGWIIVMKLCSHNYWTHTQLICWNLFLCIEY